MTDQNPATKTLDKTYDPASVEQNLSKFWIDGGYFAPKVDQTKEPFVIIMPPPNVTGQLHLGHALQATIADIMVRWHRMKGDPTLWLPGADHAGIATQVVVERTLTEENLTRQQLGREKFLERVWEWVGLYGNAIDEQHKRLGASCDWSRRRFTLDEGPSEAVKTTFFNLFAKGLIYRGERMINWCPRCSTALSDLEVAHQEEQSFLYFIKYPVEGMDDFITVATTRPETLPGDTAVAVNPEDPRYKHLIGKTIILPIVKRPLPIIGDQAVDPLFGTGALKITPGHDPVDFEIGQRHGLPIITTINLDGTMNAHAGPYEGLDRFECRAKILSDLEAESLLDRQESYLHSVGHCDRCAFVVEPLPSKQWFVSVESLAEPAIKAVSDGHITIMPDRFSRVYLNWMENIKDWCISRQLWWGHRIPAWYCLDCSSESIQIILTDPLEPQNIAGGTYRALSDIGLTWNEIEAKASHISIDLDAQPIVSKTPPSACNLCGGTNLFQDPDVLDTWFSSALWPHSTLGWPDDTEDLRYFYPTAVMETGYDILFFWVARMIMMGLENTGKIPFRYVYLTGLIRDEHGAKMSKTRGNVTDPINAIDTYGTDALRFTLTTGNAPGNDLRLTEGKLSASRNFVNKIWNASRYVLTTITGEDSAADWENPHIQNRHDKWIVSRLNRTIGEVNQLTQDFQFGEAQRQIHDFFWNEFCDWYIEMSKLRLREKNGSSPIPVLAHVLEKSLRLMHPFIPFVTEEIWQILVANLPTKSDFPASIMIAKYPVLDSQAVDDQIEKEVEQITNVIRSIRNIRAEFKIPTSQHISTFVDSAEHIYSLQEEAQVIKSLARVSDLTFLTPASPRPPTRSTVSAILPETTILVPMEGLIDMSREKARLSQELNDSLKNIGNIVNRLGSNDFIAKAPQEVVEREKHRLATLEERRTRIEEFLEHLSS